MRSIPYEVDLKDANPETAYNVLHEPESVAAWTHHALVRDDI